MLAGVIEIHDLNGAGKVQVGQIPDPDGPVYNDDFDGGPLPTSAPSLGINAEAKLFGGFYGSHIGGGVRVADGPAVLIHGGLREHAGELALACAGALSLDPAGAPLGFGGHHGDLDAVHQHIHFRNVLFGNHGKDELFGAADFLLVSTGDLRANGFGGAFNRFGGDLQTREHFHRLATRRKRHFTAHHRLHASYAGRRFQTGDTQFDVSRVLSLRAMVAQEIGAVEFD